VDFSARGDRLVSSAKDGTARIWHEGNLVKELQCSVEGGTNPANKKSKVPAKRPVQVLVRGCAFGDLEGKVVYTVASARRGSAFLARWVEDSPDWQCERIECSDVPISAMSLSSDGFLLALGSVSGSVILWGVENWKPLKIFNEVHDLPVTCIAARPYDAPLQGEEDGIRFHAMSASADSRLGNISLQKPPRESKTGFLNRFLSSVYTMMIILIIAILMTRPIFLDFKEKCSYEWQMGTLVGVKNCILNEVLWAPSTHPGISVPPH